MLDVYKRQIQGQGTTKYYGNTVIEIKNGAEIISSKSSAMYIPQKGTVSAVSYTHLVQSAIIGKCTAVNHDCAFSCAILCIHRLKERTAINFYCTVHRIIICLLYTSYRAAAYAAERRYYAFFGGTVR